MRTLSADVGGTFTDLVLMDSETGRVHLDKVASTPGRADAVLQGIHRISQDAGLDAPDVDLFVHGFTVGTNALLTRTGARVVMIVTEGFRDILEIGDQMRPHLYHLVQSKPPAVVPRSLVVEAAERLDAKGNVVQSLTPQVAAELARQVEALQPEAVCICLNFAYLNAHHEQLLAAAVAEAIPGLPIYSSSQVNPQIGEYPRANTTAIAAYIGPVVDHYVSTLDQSLAREALTAPLRLMRSDGGIATPEVARENPATMMLSGPAGGVIAGAELANQLQVANLVTFDMGGTSADFSVVIDGAPRTVTERVIDGQPLRLPTLDIETISAGGGSIATVDLGGGLQVGPKSAGAEPGPACYGKGGKQATVTDAAVVLGILASDSFLGGEMPIDESLARLVVESTIATPLGLSVEEAALGIIRVATTEMNQAIQKLSVERGLDVRDFSLLAFGGAGPIYAPFMADELGMSEVIVPLNPGVFAAQGLLMTDVRHTTQMSYLCNLTKTTGPELEQTLQGLYERLNAALQRDGIGGSDRYFQLSADMRCVGQFHELQVALPTPDTDGWWKIESVAKSFHDQHERLYGHCDPSIPVEIVNLRLQGYGRTPKVKPTTQLEKAMSPPVSVSKRPVYLNRNAGFVSCPFYSRSDLRAGHVLEGPCVIVQRDTTTVVLQNQIATVTATGYLRIQAETKA